jgi:hypothetical protein
MDGLTRPIKPQNKATMTSRVVRIIFQQFTAQQHTVFDVRDQQTIVLALALSVQRDFVEVALDSLWMY